MANLVITSTANTMAIDFGVYVSDSLPDKGTWRKEKVMCITLAESDTYVTMIIDGRILNLVQAASGSNLIVDTVAGVGPSDNADLYAKLIALIA